jgi:hypothetical protein
VTFHVHVTLLMLLFVTGGIVMFQAKWEKKLISLQRHTKVTSPLVSNIIWSRRTKVKRFLSVLFLGNFPD